MSISTIAKTEAVALRISPFSNTSHVVTWLTPTHGRIATVIKGACRPKSPVFGQYDIGYLCELLFYERDHNGIHIVRECSTVDPRLRCRGDWQLTSAISYLCHLASIATPDGAHAPELYTLLSSTLSRISPPLPPLALRSPARSDGEGGSKLPPLLFWFELRLMDLLGVPPQLHRCTRCDQAQSTKLTAFSAQRGGAICEQCASMGSASEHTPLPGDVLAILRRWQSAQNFEPLTTTRHSEAQKQQIKRILGAFLVYHLDLAPECRSIAYSMLDTVTLSA